MATSEQIKSLIRSHLSEDRDRFLTVALQLAAHEAELGHGALAHEIRELIDRNRSEKTGIVKNFLPELQGLVRCDEITTPLASLVLPTNLLKRIRRILHEQMQRHKLKQHALTPRSKILLIGPPGTGKTLTAQVLAYELKSPLYTVLIDKLVTKFMGETAAKLRQIFDLIRRQKGVYFFDEFDAIGGGRTLENDVGEMRRVLNALLQFIEQDTSEGLIVAATNSPQLLDQALFRRFDDVLIYELPDDADRKRLIQNVLGTFLPDKLSWERAINSSEGLSSADISQACRDAMKDAILQDQDLVTIENLSFTLQDRRQNHKR